MSEARGSPADRLSARVLDAIVLHLADPTENPSHLYHQLARIIRVLVETGALRGNDLLPSERDIARATGLSRITVRNAMDDLHRDGLIIKRRGAGTFVSAQIDQPLSVLLGFTADMQRRGASSASRVLDKRIDFPDADEATTLGLQATDRVLRLSRVRTSDDGPLALERAVVPAAAVRVGAIGDSLYEALTRNGKAPARALQRLRASVADQREAELLEIAPGSSILHIERRSFLADNTPIEITRSAYRGDRYDFIAELRID